MKVFPEGIEVPELVRAELVGTDPLAILVIPPRMQKQGLAKVFSLSTGEVVIILFAEKGVQDEEQDLFDQASLRRRVR